MENYQKMEKVGEGMCLAYCSSTDTQRGLLNMMLITRINLQAHTVSSTKRVI
jgi:hypothetical protein